MRVQPKPKAILKVDWIGWMFFFCGGDIFTDILSFNCINVDFLTGDEVTWG